MSRYGDSSLSCKVYVGNLGDDANRRDIEDSFSTYGPLTNVWVARNPPGFAFVEFENPGDASQAIRGLNDTSLCGRRIEVEHATGEKRRGRDRERGGSRRSGGGGYSGDRGGGSRFQQRRSFNDDKCYECGKRGHYARDCPHNSHDRRRRSRSRSPYDTRSRNNSYKSYRSRSRSHSRSRSRSRSYHSPAPRRDSYDRD